jgi:protein SCO1/2
MGAGGFTALRSLAGAVACALVLGGTAPAQTSKRSAAELMDAVMWNREPIGGPFQLTDQTGKLRSEHDFRGQLMLVYFGFTTCPDICPTDLQAIGLAVEQLGTEAGEVQPLFITVDPERDTREHLADYVAMFHPRLLGLTGSAEAVESAADAYRVYYKRVDFDNSDGTYTVDHSAFIYLMDRDGKYLGFFPPGTSAEKMVEMIRPHLAGSPSR